ncbi:nucleoside triphosphate pyrophosphohydrolase [Ponticaulis sp.]|uniref:nucleoside triphosphate pyrophosphohydrolase n=1 Tax=Ponticaulis sp. TaxID=2020902 RepID=UPI00262C1C14|nr:nucleoside triphosphate pyrophosphohydrolase [Ponticaulis sp.]MDF1681488.1 nucleoside triphosphate pyrophosphohydrolase [Ponticaulis sp.]
MTKQIDRLRGIMKALRTPVKGCPWDLEQDFKTIAPYTIEEAYEVADAIEREDYAELKSELGDLLFQIVFHSQMANEKGYFDFDDVAETISDKMEVRHPHVFGDEEHRDADAQTVAWEEQKAKERDESGSEDKPVGALSGVARTLPAMIRAQKLQKRAARVGFDWPDVEAVLSKVDEELTEVKDATSSGDLRHIEEELGDLMFVLVNVCRKSGFEAEDVLKKANAKFEGRFEAMESATRAEGIGFETLSLTDQEALWQRVKGEEQQ